jgi:hypothetical protein
MPVERNPVRAAEVLSRVTAIAVDSSIKRCAAPARRQPRQSSIGASRSPYRVLRLPSSSAVSAPDRGAPPAARTPTRANWLAPVNSSSDITQVCTTSRPAATPSAPNETP